MGLVRTVDEEGVVEFDVDRFGTAVGYVVNPNDVDAKPYYFSCKYHVSAGDVISIDGFGKSRRGHPVKLVWEHSLGLSRVPEWV